MSDRTRHSLSRWLAGVRGRIVLTVLVISAVLYSLLATVGFLLVQRNGEAAVRERVTEVVDQLQDQRRSGVSTVRLATPDGVVAIAVAPGSEPPASKGEARVTRTVEDDGAVSVLVGRAALAPVTDSMRSLYRGLWIAVPFAVALTVVIAALATRRAFRPVEEITALAASITATDSTSRVPVPDSDDEIEHLAVTMNAMLDRLAAGRESQRRFTSDAAHELRTPLMALLAELEVAETQHTISDADLLRRLRQLAERLSHRVDDLVLLSTLDEEPPIDRRPTDLAALVRAEAATLPQDTTSVTVTIDGAATADVDPRLVGRAVRNLLVNARRHARACVLVTIGDDGERVIIDVDDDGPGIEPARRDVVLRRFARLDEARSADTGGAGLGLAIAASVAERHGGTLAIGAAPLGGARCTLTLTSRSESAEGISLR